MSPGSPRSSELRRKELPPQFREEHRHTRKQAALSAFPFLTQCIYTQENAAHMQYRPRLESCTFTTDDIEKAHVSKSFFCVGLILYPGDNMQSKEDAGFWGRVT